jgi:hypothetical protein
MPNISMLIAECHAGLCHYFDYSVSCFYCYANYIMPNVGMLKVIMLNVLKLSVIILNDIIPSVVMLCVTLLIVRKYVFLLSAIVLRVVSYT